MSVMLLTVRITLNFVYLNTVEEDACRMLVYLYLLCESKNETAEHTWNLYFLFM